jgi:hypothetical protein
MEERKDKDAQALGRKRWEGVPAEERKKQLKTVAKNRKPPRDPVVRQKLAANASKS